MNDPFADIGDLFDNNFGPRPATQRPGPKKPEKGIPWAAKEIDGRYYVSLDQVAELLKENDVLPGVRKGLEVRIESLRLKKEMGL